MLHAIGLVWTSATHSSNQEPFLNRIEKQPHRVVKFPKPQEMLVSKSCSFFVRNMSWAPFSLFSILVWNLMGLGRQGSQQHNTLTVLPLTSPHPLILAATAGCSSHHTRAIPGLPIRGAHESRALMPSAVCPDSAGSQSTSQLVSPAWQQNWRLPPHWDGMTLCFPYTPSPAPAAPVTRSSLHTPIGKAEFVNKAACGIPRKTAQRDYGEIFSLSISIEIFEQENPS